MAQLRNKFKQLPERTTTLRTFVCARYLRPATRWYRPPRCLHIVWLRREDNCDVVICAGALENAGSSGIDELVAIRNELQEQHGVPPSALWFAMPRAPDATGTCSIFPVDFLGDTVCRGPLIGVPILAHLLCVDEADLRVALSKA